MALAFGYRECVEMMLCRLAGVNETTSVNACQSVDIYCSSSELRRNSKNLNNGASDLTIAQNHYMSLLIMHLGRTSNKRR